MILCDRVPYEHLNIILAALIQGSMIKDRGVIDPGLNGPGVMTHWPVQPRFAYHHPTSHGAFTRSTACCRLVTGRR
jgi:hypothetical protein